MDRKILFLRILCNNEGIAQEVCRKFLVKGEDLIVHGDGLKFVRIGGQALMGGGGPSCGMVPPSRVNST